MKPFDYVNSINRHEYIIKDRIDEDGYTPFLTNVAFSLFDDTIFIANMMNRYPELPKKVQYDFYFHSVRPRKRFEKNWPKKVDHADITLIVDLYKYNYKRAREIVELLPEDEMEKIRKRADNG